MTDWLDLTGCIGYSLEGRDGRIGSVGAIVPRTQRAEPGVLIVHSGLRGCRLEAVSFDQFDAVDHERRRLLLREEPLTLHQGAPPGARDRTLTRA